MPILNVVVAIWDWLVWLYGYLDWSLVTGWAVAIVTGALAYAAFRQIKLLGEAESRSAKQVELLEKQVNLLRLERDLAMRPNVSIHVYGLGNSSFEPDLQSVFYTEPLYFPVRNMSTRPFEYIGGFIYRWMPGAPFPSSSDGDGSGSVSHLSAERPTIYAEGRVTEDTYFLPGERFVLIPVDKEAVSKLIPSSSGQESFFVISLAMVYPEAPGGVVLMQIPFKLQAVDIANDDDIFRWVGWPIYEELAVSFTTLRS